MNSLPKPRSYVVSKNPILITGERWSAKIIPQNTTLLYASSDVGREEFIGNKALAECDRDARTLIARIEAGDSPVNEFQTTMPKFCRRYRLWEPST